MHVPIQTIANHGPALRTPAVSLAVFCLCLFLGCERPKQPVNGLGGFELGKTTLAQVQGTARCIDRGQFMRCIVITSQSVAGLPTQIELDFSGKTTDSQLVEILAEVAGCDVPKVTAWFAERAGKPTEIADKHAYWAQQYIFLSLKEIAPSRCHVIAVRPEDSERIARIKNG